MVKWHRLTDSELDILSLLWKRGPSTVREVFEELSSDPPKSYTTVLKLLQLMHEKGLVIRDEGARAHIYRASASADQTQRHILRDVIARVFHGSAKALVIQALGPDCDPQQLHEIERMLDALKETHGTEASETAEPDKDKEPL